MFADNRLETEIFLHIKHMHGLLKMKTSDDCKRNYFILKEQLFLNKLLEYSRYKGPFAAKTGHLVKRGDLQ